MSVIGTFLATIDGYVGAIRTLTLHAKLRLVAVDSKPKDDSPDFRFMLGVQEVGVAWRARTLGEDRRDYLRAVVDDPSFPEPLRGAMFEDHGKLSLVWQRKA